MIHVKEYSADVFSVSFMLSALKFRFSLIHFKLIFDIV